MATNPGKVVTYYQKLLLIKLLDPQSHGFLRSHDMLNTSYLNLHQANGHQTW